MTKKKTNASINKQQDGFIEVPTYLFPQDYEYSKDIVDKFEFDDEDEEKDEE